MSKNSNGKIIAIITMCFMLSMISFVTNMAAPFGNIWGYQYSWAGMMGNMMNFAAYLFMGIPSGLLIEKIGYKKTSITALAVGIVGLLIQYSSSIWGDGVKVFEFGGQPIALNLIIYLLGAFVCGFCVCMLNTVVNPMLNFLGGGGNGGNQLIQIGGTLNSLTGTTAPLLAGYLIGTITKQTSIGDVAPLLFIGITVFTVSIIIISFVDIPEQNSAKSKEKYKYSPWQFRHFVLGAIAIFFYVGVEVGTPAQLNFYISNMPFSGAAAVGGAFAASYWLIMMAGRSLGSFISGKISSKIQLTLSSSLAIILLLTAILMPETSTIDFSVDTDSWVAGFFKLNTIGSDGIEFTIPLKCVLIALVGLSTSIMWGGIFNLAIDGLGKYTALASGIFMTMVVGGGIMPLAQDLIAKSYGVIPSYWLVIAMFGYILFYGVYGHKNVNKDIPVE
ncbi:MAG: MFS transporter [Bacteroidaceae bacterium]|nr:MFS transporter [Bacteroidaceae bacterium]